MATLFRISIIIGIAATLSGCSDGWCWPFECSASKSSSGVVDDSANTTSTTSTTDTASTGSTSTSSATSTSGAVTPPAAPGAFDLSKAKLLHADVRNWEETPLRVTISGNQICMYFDRTGWATHKIRHTSGTKDIYVDANPWIFANFNGQWVGGTFEWMTPTTTCRTVSKVDGAHVKRCPMCGSWKPKSGETVYIMVSATARFAQHINTKKRTSVEKVVWP